MNPVEEKRQARRAEDRAWHYIDNSNHHYHYYYHHHPLLQNISSAPVWNRGRGGKHYITPLYVPAKLDEAIVDLHRWQQANQVQVEPMAQINEMIIKWRDKGNNALDYDEQQANENGDQNVDRVIEENLGRAQIVVSNRYWIYW